MTRALTAFLLLVLLAPLNAEAHGAADAGAHKTVPGIGMELPDFALTRRDGKAFTKADLGTRPTLLFFGFTHCPDVCPAALSDMSAWLEQLGKTEAAKVNMVFVTVDPERDTPSRMAEYMQPFDARITGLTGTQDALKKLTSAARVYVEKVADGEKGNETGMAQVNHTASIYLYNHKGVFTGTISTGENRKIALEKIRKLIADTNS